MKQSLLILLFFTFFLTIVPKTYAIEDPLNVSNNKVGIHILFNTELPQAAKLVNSNGGDWGYVTIPIQTGDKDIVKWQSFMDQCKQLHVIPIIRLATEGDYFNTTAWRKPTYNDIIDFANFLNSLQWPVKNRYIIVYNEVNRGDEWGGSENPAEYADLLSYAVKEFKFVNPDFFIISAGLDNAAPTAPPQYMNEFSYMQAMDQEIPGIFAQVDGLASHSYPNPGFSQPPSDTGRMSIASFSLEQQFAQQLSGKKLPVFITETGWSDSVVPDGTIAQYYQQAFANVWNDPSIVAVTPFLLSAGQGPFLQFSLLKTDGSPSQEYQMIASLPKVKGQPIISNPQILSASTPNQNNVPIKYFPPLKPEIIQTPTLVDEAKIILKWLYIHS